MTGDPADGLLFNDLSSWQRWQDSKGPMYRRLRDVLDPGRRHQPEFTLTTWGDASDGAVVVALDSTSPSQVAALVDPMRHLIERGTTVAALAPFDAGAALANQFTALPQSSRVVSPGAPLPVVGLSAVLSASDHLAAGNLALRWARSADVPYIVVQHGIVTPYAPPLPGDAHLLAWSEADRVFWARGLQQPTVLVGSQLLWKAGSETKSLRAGEERRGVVTFLGQLHGAELPRKLTRGSVAALRRQTSLVYRPHPGEQDIASRIQHDVWRRQGIEVATQGSLAGSAGPIVSHFSTGILEAAAMGLPAYAYCAEPPPWLRDLWQRYELGVWGESEATRPTIPEQEPAAAVAAYVQEMRS